MPSPVRAILICTGVLFALALFSGSLPVGEPRLLWVQVKEDSPDGVLLAEPSRWAEPVATLPFNAQVEVLRDLSTSETEPLPYFRVLYGENGGFVKRSALAEESPLQDASTAADLTATGASAAHNAAKGLNRNNENTMRKGDPKLDTALSSVERTEAEIDRAFYGKEKPEDQGDPMLAMRKYRDFGIGGGLIPQGEDK